MPPSRDKMCYNIFYNFYVLAVRFSLLCRLFSHFREQGLLFGVAHCLLIAVASLLQSSGSRLTGFSNCSIGAQ